MYSLRPQQTIAATASVNGFGYWSGRDVRVEFRPAAPDTGIVFVRDDLNPPARIAASVGNRVEVPRRTTLRSAGASVEMVEHVLAALVGLAIDNCEVGVTAPEMPGCDGSSLPFVEALDAVGTRSYEAPRRRLMVRELVRLGDDDHWIEARPARHGGLSLSYRLDYGRGSAIGRQSIDLCLTADSFRRELAPSRTFLLKEEAEMLRAQGLGRRATTAT